MKRRPGLVLDVVGENRTHPRLDLEALADEMGIDPAELRRRNFIPKDAYPYQTPVALQYDSGDYATTLEMALKAADYAGFEVRREEAQGKISRTGRKRKIREK